MGKTLKNTSRDDSRQKRNSAVTCLLTQSEISSDETTFALKISRESRQCNCSANERKQHQELNQSIDDSSINSRYVCD